MPTTEPAAEPLVWQHLGWGLAGALAVAAIVFLLLLFYAEIDHGFLGLIFLLALLLFLIAFSLLVAAATPTLSMKVAVAVVDAALAIGGKLLSVPFLRYLNEEDEVAPARRTK